MLGITIFLLFLMKTSTAYTIYDRYADSHPTQYRYLIENKHIDEDFGSEPRPERSLKRSLFDGARRSIIEGNKPSFETKKRSTDGSNKRSVFDGHKRSGLESKQTVFEGNKASAFDSNKRSIYEGSKLSGYNGDKRSGFDANKLAAAIDSNTDKLEKQQKKAKNQYHFENPKPKRVDAFTGNKHKIVPVVVSRYNKHNVEERPMKLYRYDPASKKDMIRWQKEQSVKTASISISRYNKEDEASRQIKIKMAKSPSVNRKHVPQEKKLRPPRPKRFQTKHKRRFDSGMKKPMKMSTVPVRSYHPAPESGNL